MDSTPGGRHSPAGSQWSPQHSAGHKSQCRLPINSWNAEKCYLRKTAAHLDTAHCWPPKEAFSSGAMHVRNWEPREQPGGSGNTFCGCIELLTFLEKSGQSVQILQQRLQSALEKAIQRATELVQWGGALLDLLGLCLRAIATHRDGTFGGGECANEITNKSSNLVPNLVRPQTTNSSAPVRSQTAQHSRAQTAQPRRHTLPRLGPVNRQATGQPRDRRRRAMPGKRPEHSRAPRAWP